MPFIFRLSWFGGRLVVFYVGVFSVHSTHSLCRAVFASFVHLFLTLPLSDSHFEHTDRHTRAITNTQIMRPYGTIELSSDCQTSTTSQWSFAWRLFPACFSFCWFVTNGWICLCHLQLKSSLAFFTLCRRSLLPLLFYIPISGIRFTIASVRSPAPSFCPLLTFAVLPPARLFRPIQFRIKSSVKLIFHTRALSSTTKTRPSWQKRKLIAKSTHSLTYSRPTLLHFVPTLSMSTQHLLLSPIIWVSFVKFEFHSSRCVCVCVCDNSSLLYLVRFVGTL